MISPHLLRLDSSYSYRTYGGAYESPPSRGQVIDKAKREAQELWGERATFVIEPKEGKRMPAWTHMVWANGPAQNAEKNDGSELVIIWWSEMQPDTDRVLTAVDWEKHATDYQI